MVRRGVARRRQGKLEGAGRVKVAGKRAGRLMAGWGWLLLAPVVAAPCAARDLTPPMGRPATQRRHFQGNQFVRAGNPQCVSRFARPTESPHEEGYFIGGGARERASAGEERLSQEGVWGTDYTGLIISKHTNLLWWHGQRYQGGTGSYPTDGPRILHRP